MLTRIGLTGGHSRSASGDNAETAVAVRKAAEYKALTELRAQADAVCTAENKFRVQSDADLHRFLRARQYRVDAALELLKVSETWRVRNTPVDAREIEGEIESGLAWICGYDTRKRATIYIDVEHLDKNTRDLERTTKFAVWIISAAVLRSQQNKQEQLTFIFDLKQFGVKTMDYAIVKNLLYLLSNAFPERTALLLIVHSPVLFKSFWAVIKPWIDEGTASKIRFLTEPALAEFFHKDALPTQLGGPLHRPPNAGVPTIHSI